MKKTLLSLTLLCVLFLASCKKNDTDNNPGNGTGAYQPFTAGSVWKYRNEVNLSLPGLAASAKADTTVNTMTDATRKIGNVTYHKSIAVTGSETGEALLGYNNGIYSTYEEHLTEQGMDIAYLDENKAVGESWITSLPNVIEDGHTLESRTRTTVVAKGTSKTVLGKTYTDVIHTRVEVQYKHDGQFQTVSTIDYYVAKNIGVIGFYGTALGEDLFKSELFNYTIK